LALGLKTFLLLALGFYVIPNSSISKQGIFLWKSSYKYR